MTETTTKIRTRPAAVILTPAAERRIADLMAQAPEGAIGVKLSTPRRGCSGLAYSVDYVSEEAKFDEKIETPGGTFYIDGASVLYLVGSTMDRSEEHTSELQSLMRISYAVFCLKKQKINKNNTNTR